MNTLLSFFASIILFLILIFFDFGMLGSTVASRVFETFWIIIILPAVTYFYSLYSPKLEANSIGGKIDQELPFLTLHLSAISGSGIEPSNIFLIAANSKEYPATRKEIRRLINSINIYGLDLVTALREGSRRSPSKKLAELFNGMATTITSGGELGAFFSKRAESLIFEYKLDRERYTQLAETFMNIYISVVIAAPLVLMLLLVMVSVIGISMGLTISQFSVLIIFAIALINIIFIGFLHLKQNKI